MNPKLKAIGQRLRDARLKAELTQVEVARRIGKSKQIVSAWEAGRVEMPATTLGTLARIVSADVNWLLTGLKTTGEPSDIGALRGAYIPKLETPAIIRRASGDPTAATVGQSIHSCFPLGHDAFAMDVKDAAMLPELAAGDVVVVDPALPMKPGALVAAVVRGGGASKRDRAVVVRRIRFRSMQLDGPPYDLVASNTDWPSFAVDDGRGATIVGPIVAVFRRVAG